MNARQIAAFLITCIGTSTPLAAGEPSVAYEIHHLTTPADLAGTYTAVVAGATIGRGGSVAYLQNEHGVVIRLRSSTVDLRLNVSVDRIKITIAAT